MAKNIFERWFGPAERAAPQPMKQQGVTGFVVVGGNINSNETNAKLLGQYRWKTAADILANVSVVAACVRYMLNLIARPHWRAEPAIEDNEEAKQAAEFAESVLEDIEGSWTGIVRRMALYRFHGFGIHEWVAKQRDDGKIGIAKIAVRPCHTISRWDLDDNGEVLGVEQRRPVDSEPVYLPRGKVIYLVDDSLTDSPEGMGWFRHLVEPAERLKTLLGIEVMGFERDLSGIPVARAPISEIQAMVGTTMPNGETFTQEMANAALGGIKSFVQTEVKKPNTGLILDSETYTAETDTGESVSNQPKWDMELLTGEQSSIDAMANAVQSLEYKMALIIGCESMLVGREGEGSRALSEDKSRNLYLVADSTLADMCEMVRNDLLKPIWALNGLDEKLLPKLACESAAFKNAATIAQVLRDLATAGGVLAPDDPAINDLRDLLNIPRMPELTEEERGLLMGTQIPLDPNKQPAAGEDDDVPPGDKPLPAQKPTPTAGGKKGGRQRAAT